MKIIFHFHAGEAGNILSNYWLRNILKEKRYITRIFGKKNRYYVTSSYLQNLHTLKKHNLHKSNEVRKYCCNKQKFIDILFLVCFKPGVIFQISSYHYPKVKTFPFCNYDVYTLHNFIILFMVIFKTRLYIESCWPESVMLKSIKFVKCLKTLFNIRKCWKDNIIYKNVRTKV